MTIKLQYTGDEALEIIQQKFPDTWEDIIVERIQEIKRFMKMFNTDNMSAYQRVINMAGRPENAIEFLAAITVMNSLVERSRKIKEQEEFTIKFRDNLVALDQLNTISDGDKRELRQYYTRKLSESNEKYRSLLSDFPVYAHQEVVYQTRLLH
jgi:hypothetical protein